VNISFKVISPAEQAEVVRVVSRAITAWYYSA
jgi:hypothetical protein